MRKSIITYMTVLSILWGWGFSDIAPPPPPLTPYAWIFYYDSPVVEGQTAYFEGFGYSRDGGTTSYEWDFPPQAYDIQGAETESASCKFYPAGSYDVSFTVNSSTGRSTTRWCEITVTDGGPWHVSVNGNDDKDGQSWTNAKRNIQTAIDLASDGDEIWVAEGTYVQSLGLGIDEEISIYGGFNGTETQLNQRDWETNTTTIDGDNIEYISCFYIWDDCSTIDGFTITGAGENSGGTGIFCSGGTTTIANCTIDDNFTGITCWSSSSPTIDNCTFSGNGHIYYNVYQGAGISISLSSSATISNCVFSDTTTAQCGISCGSSGAVSITGCTFDNNTSPKGSGIYCFGSSGAINIADCVFTENTANGIVTGGAAIHCNSLSSTFTIESCLFSGNAASYNGGAIYCLSNDVNPTYSPVIKECVFYQNTADDYGGAVYADLSEPEMINCLFIYNQAPHGGAMASYRSSGSSLINCTFYGNAVTGSDNDRGGGALYLKAVTYPCYSYLTNCILWGNTSDQQGHEICCEGSSYSAKAIATLKYCDIQDTTNWMYEDNSYSEVKYEPYLTYHNRYDNPMFQSTSGNPRGGDDIWATGDDGFMIQYGSICQNNGDDVTGLPDDIDIDITGNDRKVGSGVDIGAYEKPN